MPKFLDGLTLEQVIALLIVRNNKLTDIDDILRDLEDAGLIEWDERAWVLTEAGRFALFCNIEPASGAVATA